MDRYCHIGLVVGQRPAVSGKIEFAIIILSYKVSDSLLYDVSMSDLQYLRNTPTDPHKYIFNVVRKGCHQGNIIPRPPCLHEASKSTVVHYSEWSVVFCNPLNKFGAAKFFSVICQVDR
jgi:hypothetical protein